jgi:hypothetical protein
VAEHRTKEISANVRRGMRQRAERGLHHGPTPFGYTKTAGKLSPSSDAETVREIFRLRADGMSWNQLRTYLYERGISSPAGHAVWRNGPLRWLLSNPVYRGALRNRGAIIEQTHEPIISDELWHRAQRRADRPRAPRAKDEGSWLEGLVRHSCGQPLYWWKSSSKNPGTAPRFRCQTASLRVVNCRQFPQSVRALDLEAAVADQLGAIMRSLAAAQPEHLLMEAEREYRTAAPAAAAARSDALERQQRLVTRRAKAEDLYLSGVRDRAWFDAEDARVASELAHVTSVLDRLPAPPDEDAFRARHETMTALAAMFEIADGSALRAILRELGHAVHGIGGTRLVFRPEYADFCRRVVLRD